MQIELHEITFDGMYKMWYRRPKWYKVIYDADDSISGEILFGYSILPDKIKNKAKLKIGKDDLRPKFEKMELDIFCLGLRDIEVHGKAPKKGHLAFDISGDAYDEIATKA